MDDLIQRMRALMAEIEHRLGSDQRASLPSAYPAGPSPLKMQQDQELGVSDLYLRKATPERPKDYVPTSRRDEDGFDPEDFIGTGDRGP
jgi:hypothetical protein